jgi:hypothetical protein
MVCSEQADNAKPICVVIDTNIWRSEYLLTPRVSASASNIVFHV